MSRKKFEVDWSRLEGMVMFDASLSTCALELGCHPDTIVNAIKRETGENFTEYKKRFLGKTVLRLKQKMIKKAMEGNVTCMIFTLKNISQWSDKQTTELTTKEEVSFRLNDNVTDEIEKMLEKRKMVKDELKNTTKQ